MTSTITQNGRTKRQHMRGYKSYRVRYGRDVPEHQAYARRLSEGGLFIETNMVVYPVDSHIVMDIDIDGTVHRAEGIIRNARKVDSRYASFAKPGMGVEFTDASPELIKAIARK